MIQTNLTFFLLWCLAAFLAGSIPFGLILVKLAGKGDIRKTGSGNIGATNVMRAGGKALGIATLLLDVAKGYVPVLIAGLFGLPAYLLAFVALAAVLGHMFTPWLKFKGGKGVATALGVALAYHPLMVVPSLVAFLALVIIFRYISLGSIIAGLVLVPAAAGVFGPRFCPAVMEPYGSWPIVAWTIIAFLVIQRHHANIKRLIQGTESKFGGGKQATKNA
jgi:acyl phosphate:glycerol-3-phosphate acyltransferase